MKAEELTDKQIRRMKWKFPLYWLLLWVLAFFAISFGFGWGAAKGFAAIVACIHIALLLFGFVLFATEVHEEVKKRKANEPSDQPR